MPHTRAPRTLSFGLLAACGLLVAACGVEDAAPGGSPGEAAVTYHKDIKPLFTKRCAGCHHSGGIGPFPLLTYQDVYRVRQAVKNDVVNRVMPPWHAAEGCTEYADNISFTPAEIKMVADWVDAGAPEGTPSKKSAQTSTPPPVAGLPRVDLTLKLPVAYTPAKGVSDDYRCFIVDWPQKETRYVTGVEIRPDNKKIVHHLIAYAVEPKDVAKYEALDKKAAGPGYPCFGGPGGSRSFPTWLAAWAPGGGPAIMPGKSGIKVAPGSKIVVQMHYNMDSARPGPDRTEVAFQVEKSAKRGMVLPFTNFLWVGRKMMDIPAGTRNTTHKFSYDLTTFGRYLGFGGKKPLDIWSAALHMHQLGTKGLLRIDYKDGKKQCLLNIKRWDFNWQRAYAFKTPKKYSPGDNLYIQCSWDNTAANQPVVNGKKQAPRNVNWGDGSRDEMCLGVVYVTERD